MAILASLDSFATLYLAGLAVVTLFVVYYGLFVVYNLWFHPLAKYPGPKLAAITPLWFGYKLMRGTAPVEVLKQHERYGPVLRIGPNELTFVEPAAWKDIYGHRKVGEPELQKDKKYHAGFAAQPTLVNADRAQHSVLRKALSHGFSEASLRLQEPILRKFQDTLVNQLAEKGQHGKVALDMVSWYSYLAFDTIGYLTFGESFESLTSSKYQLLLRVTDKLIYGVAMYQVAERLPSFLRKPFLALTVPHGTKEAMEMNTDILKAKINYRIKNAPSVPDFMGKLFDSYSSKANTMTYYQLEQNTQLLVFAGTETTMTALSSTTYLLGTHPEVLERLKAEVRSTFKSAQDINSASVNDCKYLLAVIEESFRMHSPSPANHPRYTPPGGITIAGHFIPGGVAVGVTPHAISQSSLNFTHPDKFAPERWLGENPIYDQDKREALQPFAVGPRNCIGRNLAYVELKLVLARLILEFDMENCTEGDWLDQKVFVIWKMTPLMIKWHPRKS